MKLRSRNHEGFTFYIFDSTKAWKTQFLFFETPSVGGALLLLPGLYEVTILVFPFGYSWIITTGLAVLKTFPFLSRRSLSFRQDQKPLCRQSRGQFASHLEVEVWAIFFIILRKGFMAFTGTGITSSNVELSLSNTNLPSVGCT